MPPLKPCGRIKRPPSPLGLPRSVRPAVLLAPTQPLHQAHRPHPWEVGDVHTTSTSLPAMFWERGKTATLSYLWAWTGKIKMSPVPQGEKETNLAPTGVCAPGSSLALVPSSLHISGPSNHLPGWLQGRGHAGGESSLEGWQQGPKGRATGPHTTQKAGSVQGQKGDDGRRGVTLRCKGEQLLRTTGNSRPLRRLVVWIRSHSLQCCMQYTLWIPPSPGCQSWSYKAWEPLGWISHFL